MTTLRIYDSRDHGLVFDLHDLIDLLAPRSLEASWTVSPVRLNHSQLGSIEKFMFTGPGKHSPHRDAHRFPAVAVLDHLEQLAASGSPVSGTALSEAAHAAWQVIWGQFVATLPEQSDAWVVIRAIDSTFYEVTSSDEAVLFAIRSTYKDVRVAPGPVTSASIKPI